jgi:predicted ATPase
MSRILVTGMSGTGKSSALAELGRRGCEETKTRNRRSGVKIRRCATA